MKFIGLICFIVAMVWTWNLIHTTPSVAFETHVGIHDELSGYIEQALRKKKPEASDFIVQKIWTEETGRPNELKAHFSYMFNEVSAQNEKTKSLISGWAILQQKDGPQGKTTGEITSFTAENSKGQPKQGDAPGQPNPDVEPGAGGAEGTKSEETAGIADDVNSRPNLRLEKPVRQPKRWVITEVQTTSDAVTFEEGSLIQGSRSK